MVEPLSLTPLIEEAVAVEDTAELGRLLRTLVYEAQRTTGAKYAALGVLGEHGVLAEFIYEGIGPELAHRIGHPPTGRGVLGTVIHAHGAIVLESIADHPDSVGFPEHHPPMGSFLGFPISVGAERFGNLYLTEKDGGFTEADVASVEAISHIAGAAIHTATLHRRLRRMALVEDRQRIARDLHDSVIQDLFAVGLGLQAIATRLDDSVLVQELDGAVDTLDEAVSSLRRYVFELRDTPRPAVTLDERLGNLVARLGAVYPARIELSLESITDGPWVDDAVLLTTEALSNALRHAQADQIDVSVAVEDGHLVIRVKDDGTGFDHGAISGGMGLHSMKSRAESHGGSTTVETSPGGGTHVEARFPVTPASPPAPGQRRDDPSSP